MTPLEALYAAGYASLERRAWGEAAERLGRVATLAPNEAGARYNLAKALFQLGRVDEAIGHFRAAAGSGDPALTELALESIACIIPGSRADPATILRVRQDWARRQPDRATSWPVRSRDAGAKLRIGYLSAFFGSANWMKPVWGVVNHHDRARFEIHLFSDGEDPSEASGYRDHDLDYVHVITGLDNDRVAAVMAETGIDVLVDLNGYSFLPRLRLLVRHPAPVVVGWFNMFATSGIAGVDWLVGDADVVRPEDEADYVERIHRVAGSYLAFAFDYEVPEVTPPPCSGEAGFVFGCFASQYKLTDEVLAAWAAILAGAPNARLLLKNASLDDASTRADLLGRLGVDPARVEFSGRDGHFDFLAAYARVDLALDTFPYNGGTTTTEALWMGVPVLTFSGDRWAGRTSRSLLAAAWLDEWVVADRDAYVARAVALARDPGTPDCLAALRRGLRERLAGSRVCDTARLCRQMEAFYETISRPPS